MASPAVKPDLFSVRLRFDRLSAARSIGIDFSERPLFKNSSQTLPHPRSAGPRNCNGSSSVVRTADTATRETDSALPKPVYATMEEVCYAHELRLQLRTRLLRDAAPAEPLTVDVH